MAASSPYTVTELLAAASDVLGRNGFSQAEFSSLEAWPLSNARVFEDAYTIVTVAVYETWGGLVSHWADAQAALVDLISARINRSEPKAWEGYLVLFTPGIIESGSSTAATRIRYNISRVRKLVAAGDELGELADIERALLPVLPLQLVESSPQETDVLQLLPQILSGKGVSHEVASALIDAFSTQEPLMERLHSARAR
jgi:hypothetical protein